ncbi:MAG: TIGR04283 family arsenosugar biosynthesis glycosyltransferase [Vicinamibacterales bacterium]
MIAVIVPVLNDSDALGGLLADLAPDPDFELIVVDGGQDQAVERLLSSRPATRLIHAGAGRGRQMNAGAEVTSATWLLFVHADSRLPYGWASALAGSNTTVAGGWFRFALDDTAWQARIVERLVAWRISMFGLPYGDQGLFVRRSIFDQLGGFRDWPLMEDVDFVRRLSAAGQVVELPMALRTSARRWRRDGWFRRSARNSLLVALYFAGVAPRRLARWYARPRSPRKSSD